MPSDAWMAFIAGMFVSGIPLATLFWLAFVGHESLLDKSEATTRLWRKVAVRSLGRYRANQAFNHAASGDLFQLDEAIWDAVTNHVQEGKIDV